MRVDIEDVFNLLNEIAKINSKCIDDVEFFQDGKRVEISEKEMEEWKYVGLTNCTFVTMRDWPEKRDKE